MAFGNLTPPGIPSEDEMVCSMIIKPNRQRVNPNERACESEAVYKVNGYNSCVIHLAGVVNREVDQTGHPVEVSAKRVTRTVSWV